MALLKTINTLRRDALNLAFHTLGWQQPKGRRKAGAPLIYNLQVPNARNSPAALQRGLVLPTALTVLDVVRETKDAVSLVLARPDGKAMDFRPGMFYTVVVSIDGQEHRRAYSISSAAQHSGNTTITVKRVAGGKVSNWINTHVKAGDTLRVLGPSGNFTLAPHALPPRNVLLVGGGSGITPLMSIARTLLASAPATRIHLLYGNRGVSDTIFRKALGQLEKDHGGRLRVVHVLEKPPKQWSGEVGRLDRSTFARLLDQMLPGAPLDELQVFVCGPQPVMDGVAQEMQARGLPASQMHQERFTPAPAPTDATQFSPQSVHIAVNGQAWSATAQPGQTLLEAGLASGAPMQYSCTLGGCGRCRVKVTSGRVDMPEPNCLLPEEKAQNYALSCIARPCSAVTCEIAPPQAH